MKYLSFIVIVFSLSFLIGPAENTLADQHTVICSVNSQCDFNGHCVLADTEFSCADPAQVASCGTVGGPEDPGNSPVCSGDSIINYCVQPVAVCTVPFCDRSTLTWRVDDFDCMATALTDSHGGVATIDDITKPQIGQATYKCSNGDWEILKGATCFPPEQCPNDTQTWSVFNSNTNRNADCSAMGPTTTSGSRVLFVDNAGQTTGQTNFQCQSGNWTQVQDYNVTCGVSCQTAAQTWSVYGNTCSSSVSHLTHNSKREVIDNIGPYTGVATFVCNNGQFATRGKQTCAAKPCSATIKAWSVGGNHCTGPLFATRHDTVGTSTYQSDKFVGQAGFRCHDGTWIKQAGAVCDEVYLSPSPVRFPADGTWRGFKVHSSLPEATLKIVANSTGSDRLEISDTDSDTDECSDKLTNQLTISDNDSVYLLGCEVGVTTVELRNPADDSLIRTYRIVVDPDNTVSPDQTENLLDQ